ncbi:MAG TPA: redox-regulated ATPase YchF [Deltaproteobacteria bacterium]|nr:redox-regulated ATPase YchF [Deltaproteobacteria bacterium]HPR55298.1 redox-regulated ATPase YchF [Deltaproteobacteria bacterium]HXK48489.1 redox-regulated ATPase YchF [Deltaproteobacteria bacterium]
MSFTCGIVGLPNAGKSTLFNLITRANAPAENYPFCTIDPNIGIVNVPDENLDAIARIIKPDKIIPTTLKLFDIAGLVKGAYKGEGLGNQFLGQIRGVDAIVHVVRCFQDVNVTHVYTDVDPVRDMEIILTELVMADLDLVQKRLDALRKGMRLGRKDFAAGEPELLENLVAVLSKGQCIADTDLDFDQTQMKAWGILTAKPYVIVANAGEDDFTRGSVQIDNLRAWAETKGKKVVSICSRFELEASELEDDERREFLESIGIERSGSEALIAGCYELLDLITFYTPVGQTLRAWTLKKGGTTYEAAGLIHTDIQNGFIKADVIALEDFLSKGGLHGARDAGALLTEGREFVLRDKDVLVIHFR